MESHQKNQKQRLNVKTKAQLYECMQRNGFFMPSISSTLVTVKYMISVKEGEVWCPRYEYVKLRPCPRPPLKSLMIEELHKELEEFKEKRNTGIWDKHEPDVEWLLVSLATLNPNHRYFKKDYVPTVKESRNIYGKVAENNNFASAGGEELEIYDDFFDDLPSDFTNSKSKKSIIPKSSQEQKKEKIQADIKIRAKFRQIKHQLEGLTGFSPNEADDQQKPEDIQRFIK